MDRKITDFPSLNDFTGTNIAKSYESIKIEKAKKGNPHSKHKYLKIVDGKYIYDESKMTSKDHVKARDFHRKEHSKYVMGINDIKLNEHKHLRDYHSKLAKEKVESEKSGEKENGFSNEAKSSFDKFLLEINDLPEQKIKEIMGDDYIDTPGYNDDLEDYDDIQHKMLSQMGEKDFEKLESWYENNVRNKDLKKSLTETEAFNILNLDLVKGRR